MFCSLFWEGVGGCGSLLSIPGELLWSREPKPSPSSCRWNWELCLATAGQQWLTQLTCCTVTKNSVMKGIEGTHVNWSIQPAGFAPPEVSGEKVLQDWDQCLHSSVAESSWEISGLFWLLQWAKQWKICYRGCSSSPAPQLSRHLPAGISYNSSITASPSLCSQISW